jgi:thioredoxin reductase
VKKKRLVVIGAGPIGLEAALAAAERNYSVRVFERGEAGDAVRRWGHVKMFSPFGMNVSLRGIERLKKDGETLPDADEILTGTEFVAHYLAPLADSLGSETVHTNAEVVAIGRCELLKHEKIGDLSRRDTPFRLLLRRGSREWNEEADVVLDCAGTFSTPNHLGDGGMPAIGEETCKALISYGVPDVLGRQRWLFENRRVLVVGAGHSAATVVRDLAELQKTSPDTEIVWATRRGLVPPCARIEDDPLVERDRLADEANLLADSAAVDFRRESTVLGLEQTDDGLAITLGDCAGTETIFVDRVIAAVGFRPDLDLARELQARTCYATEGSYNLAAALLGETGGDCLAASSHGPQSLTHPEPGYFTLGMKSYGRSPDFLIRTGREQVESILGLLEKNGA